jgi:hypothetical protein
MAQLVAVSGGHGTEMGDEGIGLGRNNMHKEEYKLPVPGCGAAPTTVGTEASPKSIFSSSPFSNSSQ